MGKILQTGYTGFPY